jgi:hypothetical protein
MNFREYWLTQQEKQRCDRQGLIDQARQSWVGCRVWYPLSFGSAASGLYGEVESINDAGTASILVGYDAAGQARYCQADVACLGRSVVRA